MSTRDHALTSDDVERHARWVRRLAAGLLRDESAAEDVVQDAWVAALTQPPAEGRLRPWLRRVVHNFAHQHHRGRSRRADRERSSRPPAEQEAPEDFARRLEAEQRLTGELARLDEPFRTTLMLRYYEDLEPAEIAARLETSGGTVRWRLKRALELLRERLDRAHGGDRRAWSLALAPLARLDLPVAMSAAATLTLPGVLTMSLLKVLCAAGALLALFLGLLFNDLLPGPLAGWARREAPLEVGFRPLEKTAPEQVVAAVQPVDRREPAPSAVAEAGSSEASTAANDPARVEARIFGRGHELVGAQLTALRRSQPVGGATSAEDGRVAFSFPFEGERDFVTFEVSSLGLASQFPRAICAAGFTTHLGSIELAPGGAVSGQVVDENGVGLANCRVWLGDLDRPARELEEDRLMPGMNEGPYCMTDASGRFRLLGVPVGMVRLWAYGTGRLGGYTPPLEVQEGQESFGVVLTLTPLLAENCVRGIVLDPSGGPVPHARLEYLQRTRSTTNAGQRKADADGRFAFILPLEARLWITAHDPEGRWSPSSISDRAPGDPEVMLQLSEPRRTELVVRSRTGEPLRSVHVESLSVGEEKGEERVLARVDGAEPFDGRVSIPIVSESFRLRIRATAHQELELGPFAPDRIGQEVPAVLEPIPGLRGLVLRDGRPVGGVRVRLQAAASKDEKVEVGDFRVRLRADDRDETRSKDDGAFVLTAREPGAYYVRAEPEKGIPAELGHIEVGDSLSGPPLEIHLGQGGAIEGNVRLGDGASPEGLIVGISRGDLSPRTLRVGPDGTFRFEGLIPGPWRVELRDAEFLETQRSISTRTGGRIETFALEPNCTVHEGQTTRFDLDDLKAPRLAFAGRLMMDGKPASGWRAQLGPSGELDFEFDSEKALDSDGRFRLEVEEEGEYRLMLRLESDSMSAFLFDEVIVQLDAPPWELDLYTGQLELTGVTDWTGEGMPAVVHYWKGPGELFGFAAAVQGAKGSAPCTVPAGRAELRVPNMTPDPEAWPVARTIDVPRGGVLRVQLDPKALEALAR